MAQISTHSTLGSTHSHLSDPYTAGVIRNSSSDASTTVSGSLHTHKLHIGDETLDERDIKALKRFLLEHYPEEYV